MGVILLKLNDAPAIPLEPNGLRLPSTVPAAREPANSASETESTPQSRQILRFRRSERLLHWSIAVPFMVCLSTGMVLIAFYGLHSEGASRNVLSWLHRIAGAGLIVFPTLSVVSHWSDSSLHWYNVKEAWVWALADLKWLALMGLSVFNRRITLPEQGKFNAAEKLNFLMVMCTYPLFIATGLLLWMPGIKFLSWIVHVGMALAATPLILGHIYMALINPDTRGGLGGMLSGYVDRHWAKHHYRRWYREIFENEIESTTSTETLPSAETRRAYRAP
jgi:formate dehydrogenase subunit gamma